MEKTLEPHLGGHLNKTHIDEGTLKFLKNEFDIKSMLDIGCGPGDMYDVAKKLDIEWTGIDGDHTIERKVPNDRVYICDFTKNYISPHSHDLAWSVEFLEHVEEQFISNYMAAFNACKYAVVTAAPPGYPGHHHVNCRIPEYWIGVFAANGFKYDHKNTVQIREYKSTMKKPFMQRTGMFFRRHGL